jgi:hypothetical protein
VWNTISGVLSVTEERMLRFERLVVSIIDQVCGGRTLIKVRKLACLVGQLMSMICVIGSVVSLRSRAMYACINQRASCNAPVIVISEALSEMIFWKENIKDMNYYCLIENVSCDSIDFSGCGSSNICTVLSDASGLGYGGYVEGAS